VELVEHLAHDADQVATTAFLAVLPQPVAVVVVEIKQASSLVVPAVLVVAVRR
jgi:hypothetical protein